MTVHPSTLFGSGEFGYALDATDPTKVWQNNNGTGAYSVGSPVGRLDDVSGNGNHFVALANNTTRPTAQADGTVLFDGTNDILTLGASGLWAAGHATIIMQCAVDGTSLSHWLWAEASGSNSNPFYTPGTITNSVADGFSRAFTRADSGANVLANNFVIVAFDNTLRTLRFVDTGTSNTAFVDGVEGVARTYTRAGNTLTLDRTGLGGLYRSTPSNWVPCKIKRMVAINRLLTTQETSDMLAWVQSDAATDAGSSGTIFNGAATLSGSASLSAAGSREVTGAVALSASGTIATEGKIEAKGAAAVSGSSGLTATTTRTTRGTAALSGSATLTATAARRVTAASALAGTSSIAASAVALLGGSTVMAGSGTLSATGSISSGLIGAASLSGAGSLSASAMVIRGATASMQGAGAISASLSVQRTGSATLLGASGLSALTRLEAGAAAVLSGAGSVTALGRSEIPRVATVSRPGDQIVSRRPVYGQSSRPRAISAGRR